MLERTFLVEKPLCLTPHDFNQLKELAAQKRRVMMCVHNWKFAPPYVAARRAIEQGRLGESRVSRSIGCAPSLRARVASAASGDLRLVPEAES